MAVGATSKGATRISGIFDPPAVAKAALAEGVIVRVDQTILAENHDVKLPEDAATDFYPGITKEGGGPSSATTENPDPINIQTLGLGKVLLLRNTSVKPGDSIKANTSGYGRKRTRWSTSGAVLGYSFQNKTAPAGAEIPFEVLMMPHYVEVVQAILGGSDGSTALGAATKYLAAPGVAPAASQVALFVARHACVLRDLGASLKTAPGGADTVVFTVQKSSDNGATWTDTALTCTITGAAKAAQDLDETHAVSLAAGDLVAVKMVSSAGTAAGPSATISAT